MGDAVRVALLTAGVLVLVHHLVVDATQLVALLLGARRARRAAGRSNRSVHDDIVANPLTPAVSLVVAAADAERTIVDATRAALALHHPDHEVVVVDDGSTDGTFVALRNEFDLVEVAPSTEAELPTVGPIRSMHAPRTGEPLVVLRKDAAGRADAINAGLDVARHDLVCCVDAESLLEPDALLRLARPFVEDPQRVVVSIGTSRPLNGGTVVAGELLELRQPRGWLARVQVVEHLRASLVAGAWSGLASPPLDAGGVGLFRRDVLVEVGGFDPAAIDEDADLVAAVHRRSRELRRDWQVEVVPDPVCWTEVPTTTAELARQRRRWSRGVAELLWKQRRMVGAPRFGRFGTAVLPAHLATEVLSPVVELLGPVVVVAGLASGAFGLGLGLLALSAAVLFGMVLSVGALLVEERTFRRRCHRDDLAVGLGAAVLENLGYRQLTAWWRLGGILDAVRAGRTSAPGDARSPRRSGRAPVAARARA